MNSTIIAAIIGASATIVAAIIMVKKSHAEHSGHPPHPEKPKPGEPRIPEPRPEKRAQKVSSKSFTMPRITVYGEVIRAIGKDLGIRAENEAELRAFWWDHRIETDLDWFGKGPPVVSIGRKDDIARVKPGDRASITLEVVDRGNKRGTKTVAFELLSDGV